MTDPRPAGRQPARGPGGAVVFWASAALFAIIFALLTFQLGGGTTGGTTATVRPVQVRKLIKRRIVTTVAPGSGVDHVVGGPATSSAGTTEAPVEPLTTSSS